MKIRLNQIFSTEISKDYINWIELTRGRHEKSLNIAKGIEFFKKAKSRTPVIIFHINPYKEDQDQTPWRDLSFQKDGRIIYNGDNKSAKLKAHEPRGNKKVLDLIELYFSSNKQERMKAPPIIVTRTVKINGKTGFREFLGYGLICTSPRLVQQYEKINKNVFSNYQFEVTLLSLSPQDEFDWSWIDDRRDSEFDELNANRKAPEQWLRWINYGNEIIDQVQLKIRSYRLVSEVDQRVMPLRNQKIIDELLNKFYPNKKDGIRFEALASFVTKLYFENYTYDRGWITVGTGDRGVDFVGRLDLGHDSFSSNSIIVLGQSKRYKGSISGEKLTRVASRMTRGYIGVVITLGTFTQQAQQEIKDDQLPIILINGKKVSELLLNYMNRTQKSLTEIVAIEDEWAKTNLKTLHYSSIIDEL